MNTLAASVPSGNVSVEYETLSSSDLQAFDGLIEEISSRGYDPLDARLYDDSWRLPQIPAAVRGFLHHWRQSERSAACLLRGFTIDDAAIGPTPADRAGAAASTTGTREKMFLALIAMCLGDVFAWATLQGGRLISDVFPVRGDEYKQSGHGSRAPLEWHTEDAFHPYRCDYLLLFGMRNPDRIPTTVASIRAVRLHPSSRAILAQPRYYILPDDEHVQQLAASDPDHPILRHVRAMRAHPAREPVLFGDLASPYLRIDPWFMRCGQGDVEAEAALRELIDELARVQESVIVQAGHVLIIDNYLAVHGRPSFKALHHGADRWLKKAMVTRDLRKSRSARLSPRQSRILT